MPARTYIGPGRRRWRCERRRQALAVIYIARNPYLVARNNMRLLLQMHSGVEDAQAVLVSTERQSFCHQNQRKCTDVR